MRLNAPLAFKTIKTIPSMIVIMKPPCEFYFSHGNYLDKPIRRSKVAARSYILVDRIRQVSNQLVYRGSFRSYDPKPGFSKGAVYSSVKLCNYINFPSLGRTGIRHIHGSGISSVFGRFE